MQPRRNIHARFITSMLFLALMTVLVNLLTELTLPHIRQALNWFSDTLFMLVVAGPVLYWQLGIRFRAEEEAISRKLHDLAVIAEKTINAVVITNERGEITWVNDGFVRITGFSAADVIGHAPGKFLQGPLTDPEKVEILRQAVRTGQCATVELINYHKSGRAYRIHIELIPRHHPDGSIAGFMAIEADVTQRYEMTQAVLESERRFRTMADSAPLFIWTTDATGQVNYFNKPWLDFTGEPIEKALSEGWERSIHPDDRKRCNAAFEVAMLERQPFTIEIRLRRYDGEYRTMHRRGVPRFRDDGAFDGFIGACVDITEIRLASFETEQLARQLHAQTLTLELERERLNIALSGTGLGSWDWKPQSGEVQFDRRWAEIVGETYIPGTFEEWSSRVHPDDLAPTLSALEQCSRGQTPMYEAAFRMRHSNGSWRWVQARGVVVTRDASGLPTRMVGTHQDVTDRREIELAAANSAKLLAESNAALEEAQHFGSMGNWAYDLATCEIMWSKSMFALFGRDPSDGPPDYTQMLADYTDEDATRLEASVRESIANGTQYELTLKTRHGHNGVRYLRAQGCPKRDSAGQIISLFGIAMDVTEEVEREHALKEAQARADSALRETEGLLKQQQLLLESTGEGIFGLDRNGLCTFINGAAARMLGFSVQELIGFNLHDRFHHHRANGWVYPQSQSPIYCALRTGKSCRESDEVFWRKDGTPFPVEYSAYPMMEDGAVTGTVTTFSDITERKRMEEELRAAARTDRLTGLPNRELVSDRLQQAVNRSRRLVNYHFAVLFLDFDRFKTINDSLGHDVGDQLLKEIALRLRQTIRPNDSLTRGVVESASARLGGDEFVVILDGLVHPSDATVVADRLLEVFARPYRLGEHEVYSTASIGIVTNDVSCDSAEAILRDADTAMYEAKLAGKGQYVVFDVSMRQRVQKRLNIENDLRRALASNQLFVMYQPIVSLQTGQIESFEALVRWTHPEKGTISPGEFIPIAEDTGLIVPIGEWVLHEACRQFAGWRQTMGSAAPVSISVNLSRNQLGLSNLPETILRILNETGVAPECLHLEVTESAVMKDADAAIQMLHKIKALGVKLDMDDFGTGHSSLSCLHQFPIDVLKIDRSFVANIDRGRDFAALVHAVAQLARNLNIKVVAEGIETLDHAMILQSLDCEFGQGYLFSKPIRSEDVIHFRVKPIALAQMVA